LLISDYNKEQYRKIYESKEYGVGGKKWAVTADAFLYPAGACKVLDYGSGKGTLSEALRKRGYEVVEFEPAIEGKDVPPEDAFDAVVTTDVLEHVEPELIENVMDYIAARAPCVFAVIVTRKAVNKLPDGSNAHPLVQDAHWWLNLFEARYRRATLIKRSSREAIIWAEQ
jgi:2-polyprenyl-3-methyl-5-hydroxy-6-metoxy-1,4-benzoquinol methylase